MAHSFNLREVFPYLNAFRNQLWVMTIPAPLLLEDYGARSANLAEDLLLLVFSGIRLVVVPDHEDLITQESSKWGISRHAQEGQWIIPKSAWPTLASQISWRHFQIQATLSRLIRREDLNRQFARIHGGAYIRARTRGIFAGVDLGHNGEVRSVDDFLLRDHLQEGGIALIPALAPSATGTLYWVGAESLSVALSLSLQSTKWIRLVTEPLRDCLPQSWIDSVSGRHGLIYKTAHVSREGLPAELTTSVLREIIAERAKLPPQASDTAKINFWQAAVKVADKGRGRVHVIDSNPQDLQARDNLLTELFTHHGSGLLISPTDLEQIRPASINDVSAIVSLIAPLEQDGTLVPRSREQLERDIEYFWVAEHDGRLIACAALLPMMKGVAELACMAVAPDERRRGLGERLLAMLEMHAQKMGLRKLFLLTSRTHEWFAEHDFVACSPDDLPPDRRQYYDNGRCSRVMVRQLTSLLSSS